MSVYRREDGYYLVVADRTTAGVWIDPISEAVKLPSDVNRADLGAAVLGGVASSARVVPHPQRHEWARRRASSHPLLRQAGTRSWRAFNRGSSLVQVSRADAEITVTPMRPLAEPQGAYQEVTDRASRITSPSSEELGAAIIDACDAGGGR